MLVVDDEEAVRNYLEAVLRFDGYTCRVFPGCAEAVEYLTDGNLPADLLLTDIRMPSATGIDLLRSAKALKPEMPVILVSGLYELALAIEALDYGADDYLRKPVRPQDVLAAVGKFLQQSPREREETVHIALQEFLAERNRPESTSRLHGIFQSLGFRRYETFQHSRRVAAYSRRFGERLGLDEGLLERIEAGALLHDIGKIGVPRNVLLKPGALNDEEWAVMREHPAIGKRLLGRFDGLDVEAGIVQCHHERWDGQGYPQRLAGEDIPLGARLFSIVDTFDAVTSDRPYRSGRTIAEAKAEIARATGTQFDPALAAEFLTIPDLELEMIRERFPDQVGDDLAAAR